MTTQGQRPTASNGVDVSAHARASGAGPEHALFHGYRTMQPEAIESRPCVCGGIVQADPTAPGRGVAAHNHSPRHKAWRLWREA